MDFDVHNDIFAAHSHNPVYVGQDRNGFASNSPSNNFTQQNKKYLSELMQDLRRLNALQTVNRGAFKHVSMLLGAEIDRVWRLITPGAGSSRENHTGDNQLMLLPSVHDDGTEVTMQEKIAIPHVPKCNFIGRILGPCGISVKQLESETDCHILIRGKGSVKDPVKEARLRGTPGWEHLSDPLHVLVTATDTSRARCSSKLAGATEMVSRLLTPQHDEYKRRQLMQLAIINGTYRQDRY